MITLANALDDTMAGGATLEEAAASLSLTLESYPRIDRTGNDDKGQLIESLPNDRTFRTTVFSTPIGQESLLTEAADGGYFVVRVLESIPATTRPLSEVRDEVIADWQEAETARVLTEKANAMVEALITAAIRGARRGSRPHCQHHAGAAALQCDADRRRSDRPAQQALRSGRGQGGHRRRLPRASWSRN